MASSWPAFGPRQRLSMPGCPKERPRYFSSAPPPHRGRYFLAPRAPDADRLAQPARPAQYSQRPVRVRSSVSAVRRAVSGACGGVSRASAPWVPSGPRASRPWLYGSGQPGRRIIQVYTTTLLEIFARVRCFSVHSSAHGREGVRKARADFMREADQSRGLGEAWLPVTENFEA
jgi:hypothetical protein